MDQFLHRGASLRNTGWTIGVVVYTGHESKIMKNSTGAATKFTKLELETNRFIWVLLLIQVVLCVLAALYSVLWTQLQSSETDAYLFYDSEQDVPWYETSGVMRFLTRLGNWVLIFTNFVPISLMVTMEMVKFL